MAKIHLEPQKHTSLPTILWSFGILLIVVLLLLFALPNLSLLRNLIGTNSSSTTINTNSTSNFLTNSTSNFQNQTVNSGSFEIVYPPDDNALVNYTLSLINSDRQAANLSSVSLSHVPSAQEHSYSMFRYSYFSHWDTRGFKPYMRYTLLNGSGFVDENVAYENSTLPSFFTTHDVEQAVSELEFKMIHDDVTCCQNGHRDNILSPYHNRVSIGISYDSNHVYFVEDFENYYASLNLPLVSLGHNIVLKGNTTGSVDPVALIVFFDRTPSALNSSTLNAKYNGPYSQGNLTGGVLPCSNPILQTCQEFPGYITAYASTWQVTNGTIDIEFSLSDFVKSYGNGVYTLYLEQGSQNSPEFLTGISIFVG